MKITYYENHSTNHCCERMEQRTKLKGDEAIRFANNAVHKGRNASFYTGKEKRYLEEKERDDISAVTYNGYCFIINKSKEACVTMYELPEWFGRKEHYQGKEKIRNYKKYMRFNSYDLCRA